MTTVTVGLEVHGELENGSEFGSSIRFAAHKVKNMSEADCARTCVKAGSKYALVVGTGVYTLQGHGTDLQKLTADDREGRR